jgi:hypothetical protein
VEVSAFPDGKDDLPGFPVFEGVNSIAIASLSGKARWMLSEGKTTSMPQVKGTGCVHACRSAAKLLQARSPACSRRLLAV